MIRRMLSLALLSATVAGCASLATDPAAPVPPPRTTVTSDPADARCRVVGARTRQALQPTPMMIDTAGIGFPVSVTCERAGYQPTTEVLYPRPAPSLLKALAAGAKVSPMVDDAAPAGAPTETSVPATLIVRLRPALFTTAAARDGFFERLRSERQARWQALWDRVDAECRSGSVSQAGASPVSRPAVCQAAFDALARQRNDDLRQLEIDRRRSTFR